MSPVEVVQTPNHGAAREFRARKRCKGVDGVRVRSFVNRWGVIQVEGPGPWGLAGESKQGGSGKQTLSYGVWDLVP